MEKNGILLKFVNDNGLVNFQFFRLMQNAQKHEDEFMDFILENEHEISNDNNHCMENLFTKNVNSLSNQEVALLLFIELHMMNIFDGSSSILCNLYLEVIDKIKNNVLGYRDLFCEEDRTLSLLGYSSSIEVYHQQTLYSIVHEFEHIINNH